MDAPDLYNDSNPDFASTPVLSTIPPPHHPELVKRNKEKRPAWDHPEQPAPQKAKGDYSAFAKKMMEKAGWKQGTGLGREQQGIAEPIEASENIGRAGLGFAPTEKPLPRKAHTIDIYRDIPHKQEVPWISCPVPFDPNYNWTSGLQLVPHIDYDYDQWCTRELVAKLFERKDVFNNVPDRDFRNARHSANPYETIGKAIFCNRAAVKMANLDHLFDLCAARDEKGYLVFADICAGPGGFTEYIMWRKKGFARGWGFTLVGQNDFQLNKFHPDAPTANFTPYYGVDKTGNIYLSENVRAFAAEVSKATGNKGLALVTADGGFNVDGEENFQEVKVRQLVMCQFLTALALLKQGGDFVCKLFDVFTPFTAELLYILYCHFDKFTLLKPYSSRPANSERYVCCKGLKMRSPPVVEYLFKINDLFNAKLSTGDILHIVDPQLLRSDTTFTNFVRNHNIKVIEQQIEAIDHLIMYMEDPELLPVHQAGVRRRCLQEWNLPDDRALQRGPLHSNNAATEGQQQSSFSQQDRSDDPNKRKVNPGKQIVTKRPKEEEKFELTADKLAAIAKYKAATPAAKPAAPTASAPKAPPASATSAPVRKAPSSRKIPH